MDSTLADADAEDAEPTRRGRASWGTITRESLIQAAMEEIAAGRFERLTVRTLAARLGVAPMSLYRHVRNKEDLLDEVTDRLLAEAWEPALDRTDTRAWLVEACDRFRGLLVRQPAALHVFLSHPVTSAVAMVRQRSILDALEAWGLDEQAARRLYAAMHTYTLGFAALEASRARWLANNTVMANPETAWLAAMTSPRQFAAGLTALLDGSRQIAGNRGDLS